MNKKQEKHTSKGITLIALVITIIVMLILVAVTIQIAVNGGLFEYAGRAAGDTKNAIEEENNLATGRVEVDGKVYESIEDYIAGREQRLAYDKTDKNTDGTLKSNAKYDSDGKTAIIPKGFKIIEDAEGKKSIDAGLVIQDSEGNEFVWIPVTVAGSTDAEKEENFEKIKTTKDNQTFSEPYTKGYKDEKGTEEIKDYQEMRKSVIENGGFYIGRYEAGVGDNTPRKDKATVTNKMVVQRDKYPYIYVGWGLNQTDYESDVICGEKNYGKGALYLSKHMYDGKDVGATSTLCYGIQWDAAIAFAGAENFGNGNYYYNLWTITRETASYSVDYGNENWKLVGEEENKTKTKTSATDILLTTGASEDFKIKNMFDLAGNVYEWTNEQYYTYCRVVRGGYSGYMSATIASARYNYYASGFKVNRCDSNIGFRPVLYIK